MIDISELEKTTEAIIAARRTLAEAREQVIELKEMLKSHECRLIMEGIPGKNKEERDAHLYAESQNILTNLVNTERLERAAVLELEVCKDIRRCQENIIAIEKEV